MTSFLRESMGRSLWVYHLSLSCCALEVNAAAGPRFDWERFGCKLVRDHRNADVLWVSGPITLPLVDEIKKIHAEMRGKKYVVASGSCASTGGMFSIDTEKGLQSLEKYIPVDIFIPGCPPRPESMIHAMLQLQAKAESV